MQIGDTLFSVFVNASWNYQKTDYPANQESNYYNAGIGISIPIDFNAPDKIQKTKLNVLKSNIVYLDKKNQLKNEYIKILLEYEFWNAKVGDIFPKITPYHSPFSKNNVRSFLVRRFWSSDLIRLGVKYYKYRGEHRSIYL